MVSDVRRPKGDNMDTQKVNCIIIHGCPSNIEKAMNPETRTYDKHWIPWAKKELLARGIKTETPLMPTPWNPDYEKFKKEFEKCKITENTILIGHSCGCAFVELERYGHYILGDMRTEEFPKLIESVLLSDVRRPKSVH